MTTDELIAKLAREEIAKQLAATAFEATLEAHRQATAVAERRTAEIEFDNLVRDNAIYGGVIPTAAKYFVRDARELFEIRDGILHPRNGETQPGDPCAPLTFDTWLQEQRKDVPYLFTLESGGRKPATGES
jgi:hypothetical protein